MGWRTRSKVGDGVVVERAPLAGFGLSCLLISPSSYFHMQSTLATRPRRRVFHLITYSIDKYLQTTTTTTTTATYHTDNTSNSPSHARNAPQTQTLLNNHPLLPNLRSHWKHSPILLPTHQTHPLAFPLLALKTIFLRLRHALTSQHPHAKTPPR